MTYDKRYSIVGAAALVQFTVIGLLFAYGVFFSELEREFGWSRAMLSSATSIAFLGMGFFALLFGRLSDSIGPRPVLLAAGAIYGIGFMLLSQISAPWHLIVIMSLFGGIGLGAHDVLTLNTVAKWFEKKRGIMTAVVKVGTAIGQLAVPPLVALLLIVTNWRWSFFILGLIGFVLLVASATRIYAPRKETADDSPKKDAPKAENGLTLREALHNRQFWTLCAIQACIFPTVFAVPIHIVVHGRDLGLTATSAALLLSVIGGCSIFGRLFVGNMVDQIGSRLAMMMAFTFMATSLLLCGFITSPTLLFLAMALYGVGHGGFFTVVSPAVAEIFGLQVHATLFGIILFCGTIGGSIGPVAMGYSFDVLKSYQPAFIALFALAALAGVLAFTLPRLNR